MRTWLRRQWNKHLRAQDRCILLPKIIDHADTINQAVMVFTVHVMHDSAWQDLEHSERGRIIARWICEDWRVKIR